MEEYEPKIVYIEGIHNTVADTVSQLEYDPSVNQTAEIFHTTTVRNKQSHQRQNWMMVLKKAYGYFVLLAVCSAICSAKFGLFCQAEHTNG